MAFEFNDAAKRERDRRLRRKILDVLQLARHVPRGGMNGDALLLQVETSIVSELQPDDGDHFLALCRDLVNKGLITQVTRPSQTRYRGERFAPRHVFLAITDKGSSLLDEAIEPDPGVYDNRIAAEDA